MRVKRFIFQLTVTAWAWVGVGCVPNQSPIRILGGRSLIGQATGSACVASVSNPTQASGTLDISGTTSYQMSFDTESDLERLSTNIVGGQQTVEGPGRNDFTSKEIVYTVTSTPHFNFREERIALNFLIPAGTASGQSQLTIELLSPATASLLVSSMVPGDKVQLLVTFQLNGSLASGQTIQSNQVTFPISVFDSGFTGCAKNQIRQGTGPCGNVGGQDGSLVGCCTASSTVAGQCA